jgi:aspartate racemase
LRGGICNWASRWRCAWDAAAFKMLIRSGRIQNLKTLGVIGGIGPESTIEYYRLLFRAYRDRHPDGSNPSILINSINMKHLLTMIEANEFSKMAEYLVQEIQRLADGGAAVGLLSANTPHVVFDEVSQKSPIPLVSIVEATCDAAKKLGLKRLGLFGTRFTMRGQFYPKVFSKTEIALVIPKLDDQAYIHDKYMNELVKGIVSPVTRVKLLAIVDRLRAKGQDDNDQHDKDQDNKDGIDGLILGGTELTLILGDATDSGIPFLDTTKIHAEAAAEQVWS